MPNLAGQALPYIKGLGSRMGSLSARGVGFAASHMPAGMRNAIGVGASAFARTGGIGIGAAAGALYGAISDDTSVLGGAMMGAGIGAGMRYGAKGISVMNRTASGGLGAGFTRGFTGMARRDFRSALAVGKMSAVSIGNTLTKGYGRIRGLAR